MAMIAGQLALLGMHASNSYLVAKKPEILSQLLVNTFWVAVVLGIPVAIITVVVDRMIGQSVEIHAPVMFILFLAPINLLFICVTNLAVGVHRPQLYNLLVILNGVVFLTLAAFGMLATTGPLFFLSAFAFASVAVSTIGIVLLLRGHAIRWRFDRALFTTGIGLGIRAHVATLIAYVVTRVGVVVLRHYGAFSDVGHWSVAMQVHDTLMILPGTIGLLLYPAWLRANPEARWAGLNTSLFWLALAMGAICAVMAILAPPLIVLAFGAPFEPAGQILVALLPSAFFLALTSIVSQFLTALGVPIAQLLGWGVTLVLQVLLSVLMVERYGVQGVAYAQSTCAAFICLWLYITAKRHAKIDRSRATSSAVL
ncbi:MAG: polysaccharide biosynthesis C-terminal domain-containing protein [Rhizobiales bacterium]|nr:polysaccharide biosynthesis C-terminal domain-containing protein [Hyphomicrobiales bacterium]